MSLQLIWNINSSVFELLWKIKIDSDEFTRKINKEYVSSTFITPIFGKAKEIKWRLKLYPKGDEKEFENCVSIYLKNISGFAVEATVSFSLLNLKNERVKEKKMSKGFFNASHGSWGFGNFVKPSFLKNSVNNLVKDGEITIGCHIIVNGVLLHEQKSFSRLNEFDDFEKILLDAKFSDVTVISADHKKMYLHKAILVGRSPIFAAMFEHDMTEKYKSEVNIKDVKYEILLEVFRFIYSGKVNKIGTILFEILSAANKYAIESLKIMCEETMIRKLDKNNAIEYLIEADKYNCSNLKKIVNFIVSFVKDFVNTPELKSLATSHPILMYEIKSRIYESL